MKDQEARTRIEQLEQSLAELPQQIADIVIAHFEPKIAQVNETLDAMREAAKGMDALSELVQQMGDKTNENSELLGVLEQELNAVRVDLNAAREAQAAAWADIDAVKEAFKAMASVAAKVA